MSAGGFKDSKEAAFRKSVRDAIRQGAFTKSERDVVLAFFNHWFAMRHSQKLVVHPGRKKLARKAKVSLRTVASCLELLRRLEVIEAVAHLNGLHGNATEYRVNVLLLYDVCRLKKADMAVIRRAILHGSGECKNCTPSKDDNFPSPSQGLSAFGGLRVIAGGRV